MTHEKRDLFFTSRDGLRLHAEVYASSGPQKTPVVCLPGLTRNARDFTRLAEVLADDGHTVVAVDYRGRGLSDFDSDWRNYSPFVEALDVTDLLARLCIHEAHFVGTSRGGLIMHILAAMRPTAMQSVVLNDIGPVIEADGLTRIVGYVGRVPAPTDWPDAVHLVRELNARDFADVADEDWEAMARQWFNDEDGHPVLGYDKKLARSVSNVDIDAGVPELWPQFRALHRMPMLIVRGENSDILGIATMEKMCRLHPNAKSITVAGQGHAPLLRDAPTLSAITTFLAN